MAEIPAAGMDDMGRACRGTPRGHGLAVGERRRRRRPGVGLLASSGCGPSFFMSAVQSSARPAPRLVQV